MRRPPSRMKENFSTSILGVYHLRTDGYIYNQIRNNRWQTNIANTCVKYSVRNHSQQRSMSYECFGCNECADTTTLQGLWSCQYIIYLYIIYYKYLLFPMTENEIGKIASNLGYEQVGIRFLDFTPYSEEFVHDRKWDWYHRGHLRCGTSLCVTASKRSGFSVSHHLLKFRPLRLYRQVLAGIILVKKYYY